jgi:palmitoyl-protein thioesterase
MGRVMELIKSRLPGTFVYSVQVGSTVDEDQKAGFFGRIDEQVDAVCEQLAGIAELQHGFNAIGFSQVIQKRVAMMTATHCF